MKKIILLVLSVLITLTALSSAKAQTPFFLNKQGAVAEYAVKGPDGSVMSYARSTVTGIETVDERNYTVRYNLEAFDANRVALTEAIPMTTVIRDGVVEIAPNAMGMEISGKVPSYPANMSVGQQFEYDFSIKIMGMDATTKGSEKVVARENITTPAGTFDCFKIEADMTVAAMGQTQNVKTTSWISAGVGTVKTENRNGAGNIQMTQELVSLK